MGGDATYRVVTDPSEGPKAFTIQTRVTSRGELAVIMMGVDCAERIMLHESVGFDLPEDAFVFKLGPGDRGGVLDQLLAQGALKISRVIDLGHGGRPAPLCALTPGGAPQPAFEGAAGGERRTRGGGRRRRHPRRRRTRSSTRFAWRRSR